MSEWHRVDTKAPKEGDKVEICGYWTICCEMDADIAITIKEGVYEEQVFKSDGGHYLLPFLWRGLKDEQQQEKP